MWMWFSGCRMTNTTSLRPSFFLPSSISLPRQEVLMFILRFLLSWLLNSTCNSAVATSKQQNDCATQLSAWPPNREGRQVSCPRDMWSCCKGFEPELMYIPIYLKLSGMQTLYSTIVCEIQNGVTYREKEI